MAWCPKCKYEYVEGIEICPDCGCELVDQLPEENIPEFEFDEPEDEPEETDESDAAEEKAVAHGVYVNNEERAEENRTSAYTLLSVGAVGFVVVILFFFEIIPIHMAVFSRYMISGVMGVMFLLFLVMGVVSLRNFKLFKKRAAKENNLTAEICKWCQSNFDMSSIDELLGLDASMQEELKYFQRFKFMKDSVQNQFMNLDEAYVERLVEEIYPDIFEKQDEK